MSNMFLVGGEFNVYGGRSSSIIHKLGQHLGCLTLNGGDLLSLKSASDYAGECECVIWMPSVPEGVENYLNYLKTCSTAKCLVSSKVNVEEYSSVQLISKMLKTRSNLMIEISLEKDSSHRYAFRLLDPLGNLWCETTHIGDLAQALKAHCNYLLDSKRVRTIRAGDAPTVVTRQGLDYEFVMRVNQWANQAAQLCAGSIVRGDRFFGAYGVQCLSGFAGHTLDDGRYLISRRNTDKRIVGVDDFVYTFSNGDDLYYFGEYKPSLDAPSFCELLIQTEMKYIVHFHTYLHGVPFADFVPCGDLREIDAIISSLDGVRGNSVLGANVRGHGFFALFDKIPESLPMYARPVFEDMRGYLPYA